jgi:hypothetical protein
MRSALTADPIPFPNRPTPNSDCPFDRAPAKKFAFTQKELPMSRLKRIETRGLRLRDRLIRALNSALME